jgi:hypothetical protein
MRVAGDEDVDVELPLQHGERLEVTPGDHLKQSLYSVFEGSGECLKALLRMSTSSYRCSMASDSRSPQGTT